MSYRNQLVIGMIISAVVHGMSSGDAVAAETDVRAIVERSLRAFYYAGTDMQARVTMRLINTQGKERLREMTMLRLNVPPGAEQRYYIYFHKPSDVKSTSFMVWKHPEKEDDRWIFIPAIRLVKRIAADDKRSSFVGSDFTYEDVSGRDVDDETHTLIREDQFGGRPVYVIESTPRQALDYARRIAWIDQERGIPLKEAYVDARGEQVRIFTADKVELAGGHWTVTARTMTNLQTGHRTESVFEEVHYDSGLEESVFTERSLRNPPRKWVR